MGMYDSVKVAENNPVKIPLPKYEYQTKAYDCGLAIFTITEEGKLAYTPPTHDGWLGAERDAELELVIQVKEGIFTAMDFPMHGDDQNGNWHELELVIVNNQVLRVKDYDKVLFIAEGHSLLDEVANPAPEGRVLSLLKTLGGPEAGQFRFVHLPISRGRHRSLPVGENGDPYGGCKSLGDMLGDFPCPALGFDPRVGEFVRGLATLRDGKPVFMPPFHVSLHGEVLQPVVPLNGEPELWKFTGTYGGLVGYAEPYRPTKEGLIPNPIPFNADFDYP